MRLASAGSSRPNSSTGINMRAQLAPITLVSIVVVHASRGRDQRRSQTLRLDRRPQTRPRRRQTWEASVGINPLGSPAAPPSTATGDPFNHRGGHWPIPGPFRVGIARVGDLGPTRIFARRNLAGRLSGRGRTARCPTRKTRPASSASRTPVGPAVKSHRWLCLSTNLMDLRVGANTNRYGAAGWRTLLQGGAKAPRHPSTPRGLSVSCRRRGSTHLDLRV